MFCFLQTTNAALRTPCEQSECQLRNDVNNQPRLTEITTPDDRRRKRYRAPHRPGPKQCNRFSRKPFGDPRLQLPLEHETTQNTCHMRNVTSKSNRTEFAMPLPTRPNEATPLPRSGNKRTPHKESASQEKPTKQGKPKQQNELARPDFQTCSAPFPKSTTAIGTKNPMTEKATDKKNEFAASKQPTACWNVTRTLGGSPRNPAGRGDPSAHASRHPPGCKMDSKTP